MQFLVFVLPLFLFLGFVKAQWDDDPGWPEDPDDDPPNWPTQRPTPTRGPSRPTPTSEPDPGQTDEPEPPLPTGVDTFANATVYQPDDSTHHLTSPRTENLPNNTILAVWNDPESTSDTLSIYRSTNNGFSWYAHGTAKSTVAGRKLLEPHLLHVDGIWSGETNLALLTVNAVDEKSTNIELYASWDNGTIFEFVHLIAEGGPAIATTGSTAVGEPFMVLHDNRLTVYYSDQRDGQHAQKIVHQSTADMWENWGTTIDVVASDALVDRNGMTSIAKLPNNQYMIVFESTENGNSSSDNHPVYFKLTNTPENVGTEHKRQITTTTGTRLQGAPYATWSPVGGANGTIVLSDSTSNSIYINQALGEGLWKEIQTTAGRAYAREVRSVPNDKSKLRIAGGSENDARSSDILITIIDLEKALAAK
ncbi:glycoside hydrolase family 93 protein [Cucurbitaria berberidis CBS 394.84]|uniref:Glycoside hydrolase family 93 protein n=1 Tax=Cucurbitaria berberidis CBS 394.84 TaxID=1168544 RepID=A0A9P4GS34_9PLEO|nr:glycoside hydrolase family 93 protein [Cucurbitaria berberidis CBS 394.84]KAF1850269.1 glycoside hydrolase family 93 protein [Cucurbitaria berberidis CBS 394.84]